MDNLRFEMPNINFPQINSGGAGTFVLFDLLAPGTGLIAGAAVNQNPGILSGIQNWFSSIGSGGGASSSKDATLPGQSAPSNLKYYIIAGVVVLVIVIGVIIWKRRQKN